MPGQQLRLLLFIDVDGNLLNKDYYDHTDAVPVLDLLRCCAIPVILASSKTESSADARVRHYSHIRFQPHTISGAESGIV